MENATTTSVLEEYLPRIQRAFQKRGFAQAGELADRHGALQLTFTKEGGGLARLVLLNEAVGTGEDDYRGTIDVVVQSGHDFVRRRVIACHSSNAFQREITGDGIEVAGALAESLKDEDLTDSFALRNGIEAAGALAESLKDEDLTDSFALRKEAETTAADAKLLAMDPDDLSDLIVRLLAYAEIVLRLHGPRAYRSAYTSEILVSEVFEYVLHDKRVFGGELPSFAVLAGIVRSRISHEAERRRRNQRVSNDEVDDERHDLYELTSREDVAAKATSKGLAQRFARTLDTELLATRAEVRKMLRGYGIDPDQAVHRLESKIARIR